MRKTSLFIIFSMALLITPLVIGTAEHPYFHGKTIALQVGAPAGGRQDRIARTLAKYLTKNRRAIRYF